MSIEQKNLLISLYDELRESVGETYLEKVVTDTKAAEKVAASILLKIDAPETGGKVHISAKRWYDKLWGGIKKIFTLGLAGSAKEYNVENIFKAISKQFGDLAKDGKIEVQEASDCEKLVKLQKILNALFQHVGTKQKKLPNEIYQISQKIFTSNCSKLENFSKEAQEKLKLLEIPKGVSRCFELKIKKQLGDLYQDLNATYERLLVGESDTNRTTSWNEKKDRFLSKLNQAFDAHPLTVQVMEINHRRERATSFSERMRALHGEIESLQNEADANGFPGDFDSKYGLKALEGSFDKLESKANDAVYEDQQPWDAIQAALDSHVLESQKILEQAQAFVLLQRTLQDIGEVREIATRPEYKALNDKIPPAEVLEKPLKKLLKKDYNLQEVKSQVVAADKHIRELLEKRFEIRNQELRQFSTEYAELYDALQVLKVKVPIEKKEDFVARFPIAELEEKLEKTQQQGSEFMFGTHSHWKVWQDNAKIAIEEAQKWLQQANSYLANPPSPVSAAIETAQRVEVPAPALSGASFVAGPPPLRALKQVQTLAEKELISMKNDLQFLSEVKGAFELREKIQNHLTICPKADVWNETAKKLEAEYENLAMQNKEQFVNALKKKAEKLLAQIQYVPKKVTETVDSEGKMEALANELVIHLKQASSLPKLDFKRWRAEQNRLFEKAKALIEDPTISSWMNYSENAKTRLDSYRDEMCELSLKPGLFVGISQIQAFFEQVAEPGMSKEAITQLLNKQNGFISALRTYQKNLVSHDTKSKEELVADKLVSRRQGIRDDADDIEVDRPINATPSALKAQPISTQIDKIAFADLKDAAIKLLQVPVPMSRKELESNWKLLLAEKRQACEAHVERAQILQSQLEVFEASLKEKVKGADQSGFQPLLKGFEEKCTLFSATLADETAKASLREMQKCFQKEHTALLQLLNQRPSPLTEASFALWKTQAEEQFSRLSSEFTQKVHNVVNAPNDLFVARAEGILNAQAKALYEVKNKDMQKRAQNYVLEEETESGESKEVVSYPFFRAGIKEVADSLEKALPASPDTKPTNAAPFETVAPVRVQGNAPWQLYTNAIATFEKLEASVNAIEKKIKEYDETTLAKFNKKFEAIEALEAEKVSFEEPLKCIMADLTAHQKEFSIEVEEFEDIGDFIAWVDGVKELSVRSENSQSFEASMREKEKLLAHLQSYSFQLLESYCAKSKLLQKQLSTLDALVVTVRDLQEKENNSVTPRALQLQFVVALLEHERMLLKMPTAETQQALQKALDAITETSLEQNTAFHQSLEDWLATPTDFDAGMLNDVFKQKRANLRASELAKFAKILAVPDQKEALLKSLTQLDAKRKNDAIINSLSTIEDKISAICSLNSEVFGDDELNNLLVINDDNSISLQELARSIDEMKLNIGKKQLDKEQFNKLLETCDKITAHCKDEEDELYKKIDTATKELAELIRKTVQSF